MNRQGIPRSTRIPAVDRVLARCVEDESGCWLFQGSRTSAGYGQIRTDDRTECTHRVTYEAFVDDIPAGLVIDHLCRVPACCNPWHLEPVPQRVNILRGVGPLTAGRERAAFERAKTHCPRNHAYDEQNTYINPSGHRACRACKRAAQAAYLNRKRDAA
jgi:hypothetical protein